MPKDRQDSTRSLWHRVREGDIVLLTGRELLLIGLGLLVIAAAFFWVLFTYIEPPPPKRVTITSGDESGAYFAYAKKYAAQFQKQGITLDVLPSKGSVENLARLTDPKAGVEIGLMQSGLGDNGQTSQLESLASIAYEPIWIFYKTSSSSDRLTTVGPLLGKRIAIGPEGSGTRIAALKLLNGNGIDARSATLSDQTGSEAVQALVGGKVDAIVVVAAADAPSVVQALDAGLEPISYARADAYVRLMPWLSKVTLPRGVISLARDLPHEDIVLVASAANLVVRKDLHPAIAYLLMEIAADVHRPPTITNSLGEFPSEKSLDFVQSNESKRFFKTGLPLLQRYMPFWVANLLERLTVTLLPLLAIAIPLVRFLPKLLDWRERARILRIYAELKRLEQEGELRPSNRATAVAHLDRLDISLGATKLGVDHAVDMYNLKAHLDMLRARIKLVP